MGCVERLGAVRENRHRALCVISHASREQGRGHERFGWPQLCQNLPGQRARRDDRVHGRTRPGQTHNDQNDRAEAGRGNPRERDAARLEHERDREEHRHKAERPCQARVREHSRGNQERNYLGQTQPCHRPLLQAAPAFRQEQQIQSPAYQQRERHEEKEDVAGQLRLSKREEYEAEEPPGRQEARSGIFHDSSSNATHPSGQNGQPRQRARGEHGEIVVDMIVAAMFRVEESFHVFVNEEGVEVGLPELLQHDRIPGHRNRGEEDQPTRQRKRSRLEPIPSHEEHRKNREYGEDQPERTLGQHREAAHPARGNEPQPGRALGTTREPEREHGSAHERREQHIRQNHPCRDEELHARCEHQGCQEGRPLVECARSKDQCHEHQQSRKESGRRSRGELMVPQAPE